MLKLELQTRSAYVSGNTPTKNFRDSEYHAFATVTHNLHSANIERNDNFPNVVRAVQANQKLWNILAIDVSNDMNKLPVKLKSQIFYLSEFIRHHTAKVIAGTADAEILVELNMSVMRGLRMSEMGAA
jgi:flagellar biosynthesis activator protein FlaF